MPTGLESALLVLVYALISLAGTANLYLLLKMVGLITPAKQKVEHTGMSEDNFWTKQAAEQHTKAAEKNLEAAKVNQRTEELRLERARIEKTG